MARTATCPACGAPVAFKSVASVLAVCDFCQSTLVRHGEDLENLGKMAVLMEDRSPLQRAAEGRWQGRRFTLIGRIQLKYEAGLWNEWHLLFDDGSSGWLSEAGGEYVLSVPKGAPAGLPGFESLQVGEAINLAGKPYRLTNVLTAACVAGEGELPFVVGAGYPAPVADLRDAQGGFATLDYSDDPAKPLLFVGESVDFKSLAWSNLRQEVPLPAPTVKARAFNCPSCGAPLQICHENVATVGCGSCGAVLDAADERLQVIAQASLKLKVKPLLELGSRGKLRGEDVEVIGFMRRRMTADGSDYRWSEYVLLGPDNKLLWLTEYDGHWNVAWVLAKAVSGAGSKFRYGGQEFKHFQGYRAFVDYVVGEFPWQVKLDEAAQVDDYVAPPQMLSREVTSGEVTWTLAEYLEPAALQAAFQMKAPLPRQKGVYANQPNPLEESHRRVFSRFWKFILAALAVQAVLMLSVPNRDLLQQTLTFNAGDDETQLSQEFRLDGATPRLEVEQNTDVDNNWVGVSLTLLNKDTGEAWQASREISHYHGVDEGESWSEGSSSESLMFADLPAGTYALAVDHDMDAGSRAVHARVKVLRAGPRWSSLLLALLALTAFPVYSFVRKRTFEVKRWAESDHPIVTSGDDD